jgi:hypothetical protein
MMFSSLLSSTYMVIKGTSSEVVIMSPDSELRYIKLLTDDAAEMAPNREMDAVPMPTQRPLNGAAARQDQVVVTWNAGCWADWQLPVLVVLFAGLGVLAVIFVVNIAITVIEDYYGNFYVQ